MSKKICAAPRPVLAHAFWVSIQNGARMAQCAISSGRERVVTPQHYDASREFLVKFPTWLFSYDASSFSGGFFRMWRMFDFAAVMLLKSSFLQFRTNRLKSSGRFSQLAPNSSCSLFQMTPTDQPDVHLQLKNWHANADSESLNAYSRVCLVMTVIHSIR